MLTIRRHGHSHIIKLPDYDVARVVIAGVTTIDRSRFWPVAFDSNRNSRITRLCLGLPAIMEYDGQAYVLIYKQRSASHGEDKAGTPVLGKCFKKYEWKND